MAKLSGNKGEWSEVYVFLRLLSTGRLYAADSDLNKMDDVFYRIINVIRTERDELLTFHIDEDNNEIKVLKSEIKEPLLTVPFDEFKRAADDLYIGIISSNTSPFTLEKTEDFLKKINVYTLKAKSSDKSDIRMRIHDTDTGIEAEQGFSIKSRLGSASTLINAGKTTNFIYEVTGSMNSEIIDRINGSKLFKDKFDLLKKNGFDIEYAGMENDTFESNLLLIDGDLPAICAHMLKMFYSSEAITVQDALSKMVHDNPLGYNLSKGHPFYHYKFKKLLSECALGMLPSKTWDGRADATGGYIIVREDGEVLCYHLFNHNEFEEYLINNTKFETASTTRHEFGTIYEENGKYYLKLNLQVRFVK